MGRNTEIYMLYKEKASANLYEILKNKRIHKRTFEEFITARKLESGASYSTSYEKILSIVKEDINTICPYDLGEITSYLEEELTYGKFDNSHLDWKIDSKLRKENKAKTNEAFENLGISLLYEIHTSTVCYSYMFQFGNYSMLSDLDEVSNMGYNLNSTYFLKFNDYMILTMSKLIESQLYEDELNLDGNEEKELESVIQAYKNDITLHEAIDKEIDWLKSCWNAEDGKNEPEKNTIYSAHLFLTQSLQMKRRIDPKTNPRIVITDSY